MIRPQYTQSLFTFEARLLSASLGVVTAAQKLLEATEFHQRTPAHDALQDAVNEYRAAFTNLPKGMNDHPLNAGETK